MRIKEEGERRREEERRGARLTHRLLAELRPRTAARRGLPHSYLLSGSASARLRVTKHILSGMLFRSRWKDGGCDASGSGAPAPSRGDSGGGVSQPISDTGEPLVT